MGERIRARPRGRFFLLSLSILLIGFGGINSAQNSVILFFSLLLAALATSGFFSKLNLRGMEVRFSPADRVFCCEEGAFLLRVKNKTRIPKFALWVQAEGRKAFIGDLSPGKTAEVPLSLVFRKRGVHPLPSVKLYSLFPLGMVERWRDYPGGGTVTVYPRTFRVLPHFPRDFSGQGEASRWKRGSEEIAWLRENPEAELRKIDWKAFARTGKSMEKVFTSAQGREFIVVLDPMGKGPKFEENISLVASVGIFFMKNSVAHHMVAGRFRGRVSEKNLDDFLTALAILKPGNEEQSRRLALELQREFPGHTIFAAITVPNSPLAELLSPGEMVFTR